MFGRLLGNHTIAQRVQIISEESLMNKPISYSFETYKKNDGELNSTLSNMFADATYEMSNDRFKEISGKS